MRPSGSYPWHLMMRCHGISIVACGRMASVSGPDTRKIYYFGSTNDRHFGTYEFVRTCNLKNHLTRQFDETSLFAIAALQRIRLPPVRSNPLGSVRS